MSCQEQCEKQQLSGAPSPPLSDSATHCSTLLCPLKLHLVGLDSLVAFDEIPKGPEEDTFAEG